MNYRKIRNLVYELDNHWEHTDGFQEILANSLVQAGFVQPTFPGTLQDKLDLLLVCLSSEMELSEDSRDIIERCLIETGWVDQNPIQINTLKNLAYLATAQTTNFENLMQRIRSHKDDYDDCEQFLTKRNKMIRDIIELAQQCGGVLFGGSCRDTIKGGLLRQQDGMVMRDVDLLFQESEARNHFVSWLTTNNKFIIVRTTVDIGYGIGGFCDTYNVFLKIDTTIRIKVDCVYKSISYPTTGTAEASIDFNVNALSCRLDGDELMYRVRRDLCTVSGLTLSVIASDIGQKQFRAIGILMNTTPLTAIVFSDKTSHICSHRKSAVGTKMRARADALIARGWTLTSTCNNAECWLAPLELYRVFRENLERKAKLEKLELAAKMRQKHAEKETEQGVISCSSDVSDDDTDFDTKSRGRQHRKLQEKHHN